MSVLKSPPKFARRQTGASLVSLMVGLVISMMVGLTAMGSLQAFSVIQRQSVGVGSTLGTGVSTLGVLKYELAQAGRGLYVDGAPICSSFNLSADDALIADGDELRPVNLSWDAQNRLTVDIRYASALEAATPVATSGALTSGTVELGGLLPVAAGQAVLLAPAVGSAGVCTVRTVTGVTASTATTGQKLTFASTGTHNKATFSTPQAYAEGTRVFLLGTFEHVRFQQVGTTLVMSRPEADQSATLAENVRAFSLQVGGTDGVTEALSEWHAAGPKDDWRDLTVARTAQTRALRIGVVMQAPQKEKPDAEGNCTATPAADSPTLFGNTVALADDGACFKYRTFFNVIPLRNITSTQAAS